VRKGILGFAAVLISLVVISGCGGDDSLSREEYDQQLELVCNKNLQEREEFTSQVSREFEEQRERELTPEYQAENIGKLAAVYQKMPEAIRELGLPEEDPEQVEELIRAQEEASARVLASPIGARDSLQAMFKEADEVAESLGVQSCTL
jgi:hypothetical protein